MSSEISSRKVDATKRNPQRAGFSEGTCINSTSTQMALPSYLGGDCGFAPQLGALLCVSEEAKVIPRK